MSTAALVPRIEAAAAPVAKPKRPTAPRYQPLVVLLTAAATGIVVDRYRPLPIAAWWSVVALGLACWLGLHRKRKEVAAAASLLLAVAALGAAWHHDRWNLFGADDVGLFARSRAQPVCIEAVALQSPRLAPHPEYNPMRLSQGDEVRFEIEVQAIRDGELWRSASGVAALAVEGRLPELVAGDRFRVFAHLLPPEEALNPGEVDRTALDRGRRLMAHLHVTYPEAITLLDGGRAIRPWTLLESLRLRGRRIFERYLQPRQAALASAVLLGLREQLEPDETQAFQLTGTIHLLVIAGLHLGIVAWLASVIFRRVLPCRWALPATAFFALGYMLLVEAHPPIIRATVLIVAACVAACSGRARGNFNVLALAGLVVLMLNPSDLFNVGPQLSFLCVAGLMALGPRWLGTEPERGPLDVVGSTIQWTWRSILPSWIPVWFLPDPQPLAIERLLMQQRPWFVRMLWVAAKVIRHLTLVSGAIWLLTVPLVMSRFHIFNPVAILLNTLVWLPMVLALASGLGLLLTGMICPPLASAFAACCNGMLWMIDRAVQFGAHLPGGHAWVPGPAEWWLVGFYAALAAYLAFPGLRPPRWRLAALGAWTAAGVLVPLVAADHHGLRCTFLSVGHGEAVVMG